jgi:hypothetical protein
MQHVRRVDGSRLPYAIVKYRPVGTRGAGQPLKRLVDGCIETGWDQEAQLPDGMMMMMMMMMMTLNKGV